jgi:hypothetical protein
MALPTVKNPSLPLTELVEELDLLPKNEGVSKGLEPLSKQSVKVLQILFISAPGPRIEGRFDLVEQGLLLIRDILQLFLQVAVRLRRIADFAATNVQGADEILGGSGTPTEDALFYFLHEFLLDLPEKTGTGPRLRIARKLVP